MSLMAPTRRNSAGAQKGSPLATPQARTGTLAHCRHARGTKGDQPATRIFTNDSWEFKVTNFSLRADALPNELTPARQDALLDQALKETFPASDPIKPTSPRSIN